MKPLPTSKEESSRRERRRRKKRKKLRRLLGKGEKDSSYFKKTLFSLSDLKERKPTGSSVGSS